MTGEFDHEPVMAAEVVEILSEVPTGVAVDATAGGGGHARALLEARPDLRLVALDRDPDAVAAAEAALSGFGGRAMVFRAGFEDLGRVVEGATVGAMQDPNHEDSPVVAVLFDLGVSSPQLDRPDRGFSYRFEGPLDMRMDPESPRSAADLLNSAEEGELVRILRDYGEERFARAIARRVIRRRPLRTTHDLVEAVTEAIPAPARRRGGHPAKRTFQAIRIAVNDELGQLERGLDAALGVVSPGGRIVVLSYHSLEDRIVKRRFADWASGGQHPPGLPVPETERGGLVRLITRRPLRPGADERARNPRAESARLRAVERLPVEEAA